MVLVACGTRPQQPAAHPDWSYNSVVYEMNVRQYTPEGTLAEAARHLPRLQEMGVDVVWLMPVYPIGVKERKGTLGSYYAISDYEAVNPEFGTLEDFDRFLAEAHQTRAARDPGLGGQPHLARCPLDRGAPGRLVCT